MNRSIFFYLVIMLRSQSYSYISSSAAGIARLPESYPWEATVPSCTYYHSSYSQRRRVVPAFRSVVAGLFPCAPFFRFTLGRRDSIIRNGDRERMAFACTEKGCKPDSTGPMRSYFDNSNDSIYCTKPFFLVGRKCEASACLRDRRNTDKVMSVHFSFDHLLHNTYTFSFFNHFFMVNRECAASARPCNSADPDKVVPTHFFFGNAIHIIYLVSKLRITSGECAASVCYGSYNLDLTVPLHSLIIFSSSTIYSKTYLSMTGGFLCRWLKFG